MNNLENKLMYYYMWCIAHGDKASVALDKTKEYSASVHHEAPQQVLDDAFWDNFNYVLIPHYSAIIPITEVMAQATKNNLER